MSAARKKRAKVLDFTGADGVMIGRAAQGAPWIFGAVNAYLCDAATSPPLARAEVRGIILEHLEVPVRLLWRRRGKQGSRVSISVWYCVLLPDAANIRRALMATANTAMQFALARSHLDGWVSGSAQAA